MSDERLQILKMLEEGKLSAEEAEQLLLALSQSTVTAETDAATPAITKLSGKAGKAKWLRIEVEEKNGNKVHIKLPVFIIRAALRIGGRFNIAGFNSDELGPEFMENLETAIMNGDLGMLVDVTEDKGDHVQIYLE